MRRATLIGLVLIVALAWTSSTASAGFTSSVSASQNTGWYSATVDGTVDPIVDGLFYNVNLTSPNLVWNLSEFGIEAKGHKGLITLTAHGSVPPSGFPEFDTGGFSPPGSTFAGVGLDMSLNDFSATSTGESGANATLNLLTTDVRFKGQPRIDFDNNGVLTITQGIRFGQKVGEQSFLITAGIGASPALASLALPTSAQSFSAQAVPLPAAGWHGLALLLGLGGFGLWQRKRATANV